MRACALLAVAAFLSSVDQAFAAPIAHYELRAKIEPTAHRIAIEGTIRDAAGQIKSFHDNKVIEHPIAREAADYARGFAETEGTIQPEGVFLPGASQWYPAPEDGSLVTFSLQVKLPAGWDAMSQGRRTVHERTDTQTTVTFVSDEPQEEISLVAGPWVETSRSSDGIDAIVMLREKDDTLAGRYLDATGPYLAMYSRLLGAYPYSKFGLVENFWETGYGMPSFTLLGGKVMRLPFIITSSYPHEILHNWWGNGVYVEAESGNWCEGLTAYLADHLFAEQKGGGAAYRQETLQKYADYAARAKDFPLSKFRERHSPSTEAIGYDKGLMVFHMIRRELGDVAFVKGLRALYSGMKFERASYDDVRRAFERAAGRDLAAIFAQWVARTGAPHLRLIGVRAVESEGGDWRVAGMIEQIQQGDPYTLAIPVAVTTEGRGDAMQTVVRAAATQTSFDLSVPARPVRLDLDPEFDLFRALDVEETPPALSGVFGADTVTVVLPATAAPELLAAYRAMAAEWNTGRTPPMKIVTDAALRQLPDDGSVVLVGFENRFLDAVTRTLASYGAKAEPESARAIVRVARRARGAPAVLAFVAADRAAQVPGLTRKLPHYDKYSYLAFEGDEPVNVEKGRWPVAHSPMTAMISGTHAMGTLAPRAALAELSHSNGTR